MGLKGIAQFSISACHKIVNTTLQMQQVTCWAVAISIDGGFEKFSIETIFAAASWAEPVAGY